VVKILSTILRIFRQFFPSGGDDGDFLFIKKEIIILIKSHD